MGRRVLRRVLRRGSKKGLSRRHLEGRSTPFREYDPLGVCSIKGGVCKRKRPRANEDRRRFQALWKGTPKRRSTRANASKHKKNKRQTRNQTIIDLSAPSPGDDLRSKSAIRLRGQTVRSESCWEIGCDFSAVTIRLRLRCILR